MITNSDREKHVQSGARKAAIFLIAIGQELSAQILAHLEEDEVQRVGQEIARSQTISTDQSEAIMDEFYNMLVARDFVIRGGVDYARKVLRQAFGPERAARIIERMLRQLGGEHLSFDVLKKADPQQLAKFIHNEHPQTIALILSHLPPQ
jgi:flagellar motor switch protein FliG